ncbi:Tubulin-folding cofactor B [Halotydeus destructor]|nr:Tubulin-folding cofactor B [Halotydeus destructor]
MDVLNSDPTASDIKKDVVPGAFKLDDIINASESTGWDYAMRMQMQEGVPDVPKFELDDEAYAQRGDSVRAFKERNKLGRFDEEAAKRKQLEEMEQAKLDDEAASCMKVGDRCEVQVTGHPSRRGTVRYIGKTQFKPGTWTGVQFDEPLGKNDGSVAGVKYFECPPKYGSFVKPTDVRVGDFPEEEIDFDEM